MNIITDKEIINDMINSKTIKEWNSNRDYVKFHRSNEWISVNIDSALLISKSQIK